MQELDQIVKKLARNEGPSVHALDQALASFHVERQAYYSGTFTVYAKTTGSTYTLRTF